MENICSQHEWCVLGNSNDFYGMLELLLGNPCVWGGVFETRQASQGYSWLHRRLGLGGGLSSHWPAALLAATPPTPASSKSHNPGLHHLINNVR
ncbi:hypothetical protein C1H46_019818 [Malus baccata]|uniref:Uncharacterized protein n=1 Tax=Malus baccata TaxID=106549 RepID=A0A540M746_MALBA|nr:hypothetical protein C1H46_019818 [Malus baccata]